ncbi:hypothetical protein JQS43_02795 [Natronosporangium hydrolyticum]|uniref:Uncharacterized protein n=1 Tax=Natronosporangium hydrolyticum TaxID=2811111 RepID=A0A895YN08_9ACTN|nr:hypothetical protein [Natronosporangium hydrolyticum]QSB15308.1 hypothetical protein JQS43_02795 [Natronosporangium hydrolyticum]
MTGDTSLWITLGAVGLGSAAVAGAAAFGEPAWRAWRRRRRTADAPDPAPTPGSWDIGDPKLAAQVFTSLCHLRARLREVDAPLPHLTSVLVGYDRVVLQLARPTPIPAIAPWRQLPGDLDGRCWVVDTAEVRDWAPGPSPYPGLTLAGTCDGWHVLIDLARAPGPIGIVGDPRPANRLVTALTQAVATAPWSRELTLITAGPHQPVPPPRPDTVVLRPEPAPPGGWNFYARPDGQVYLEPANLLVDPIGTSPPPAAPPTPWRAAARALAGPALTDQVRDAWCPAPVTVGVLGPLRISAPGEVDPTRGPVLSSLLATAAIRPTGAPLSLVHGLLTDERQIADAARHVHDWLGADHTGLPRLRATSTGWRLAADVRSDWHLFRELVTVDQPDNEWARLLTALSLIRGELLAATPLLPAAQRVVDRETQLRPLVIKSVRRAAALAAERQDPAAVAWVLRQGLTLYPRVQGLWRTLLLFQADHEPAALPHTVDEMMTALRAGGHRVRLERSTKRLVARHRGAGTALTRA